MLKLDLLSIQFRLSDRELMRVAQVNVAYRLFLDIGCDTTLPHHTTMTYFRDRVGAETLRKIFHGVLGQARERGIVGDRLRLKDATHIIANIAIPSTIRLGDETRDHLLDAAKPLAPALVAAAWPDPDAIATGSDEVPDTGPRCARLPPLRSFLRAASPRPH